MWTGFERRVVKGGHIQVPENLAGRTVLVMFDTDDPVCGDASKPHVGFPCLNCGSTGTGPDGNVDDSTKAVHGLTDEQDGATGGKVPPAGPPRFEQPCAGCRVGLKPGEEALVFHGLGCRLSDVADGAGGT